GRGPAAAGAAAVGEHQSRAAGAVAAAAVFPRGAGGDARADAPAGVAGAGAAGADGAEHLAGDAPRGRAARRGVDGDLPGDPGGVRPRVSTSAAAAAGSAAKQGKELPQPAVVRARPDPSEHEASGEGVAGDSGNAGLNEAAP